MKKVMRSESDEQIHLALAPTIGRSSKQIKAEIKSKFGFIPSFFEPAAQNPQILENLWQQTLSAYVNNPLPALFKEKLFAYLSRFCIVPYYMICHSCNLRSQGVSARQILELLQSPLPGEKDIDEHLKIIAAQSAKSNSSLEDSLFYCAVFMALTPEEALHCRQEVRRILNPVNYQHLIALIAYIKMCHIWIEAHPEVPYEADRRTILHLAPLLEEEPELADFFRHYQQIVKFECQSRTAQLAEIAARQRQEESWRQQAERERLVVGITQRIRSSLNLGEILNTTVSEVQQFLQVDRTFIYRFLEDWSGFVAVESVASGWTSILGKKITDSFFAEVASRKLYQEGRTEAIEDINTAGLSKCHIDLLARLEIRSNLVIPIVQGEQLWGLLVANHCCEPRQWQQLEIDLLKHLATQVAIAIQQSILFEQVHTELLERQRSQEKIHEQAALLDVATDAIIVQALDHHQIRFWNKSAEHLYGWKAADALGKDADQLLFKETSSQLQQAQQYVVERGSWQGELIQVNKEGKEIIVESRWTLVLDLDKQPQSILIVNTDITEKKQLEAQFLRTQRLESIGTLAGGIAHDLNNVLTPIIMASQLLLQTQMSAKKRQPLLTTIEKSARRGAGLVKQVLSFARGMEGKRTSLQLSHLLWEIRQIVKETFPKSIEVEMDLSPDLWVVSGDATQLHQMLMNLVVNARDAMPKGGILKLGAENLFIDDNYAKMNLEATVGPHCVITVSDTGIGMTSEILARIFEPFFTTKEQGKGTGLGLSTLIGIVKSHGGFVTVESKVDQGTQFQVYLPAVLVTQTPLISNQELPKGQGELILVVDDESAIREITQASLVSSNYRVIAASDGIEAIALYVQHKNEISAVLMDMMMPELNGLNTIQILKQVNPHVLIIAISGVVENEQVNIAMDKGIKAFLSKPYTLPELLKTLHSVLGEK